MEGDGGENLPDCDECNLRNHESCDPTVCLGPEPTESYESRVPKPAPDPKPDAPSDSYSHGENLNLLELDQPADDGGALERQFLKESGPLWRARQAYQSYLRHETQDGTNCIEDILVALEAQDARLAGIEQMQDAIPSWVWFDMPPPGPTTTPPTDDHKSGAPEPPNDRSERDEKSRCPKCGSNSLKRRCSYDVLTGDLWAWDACEKCGHQSGQRKVGPSGDVHHEAKPEGYALRGGAVEADPD
ncbi:unnamed protein product [marine sediment metagenome]|uniref:Uncharacterized protein n=1 Tax=marine sediment metagenome TaxID=412755 RepID=X0VII6_9ZZZZ